MKKSFKTLTIVLLLCLAFILGSCAIFGGSSETKGDFVKPSTKVLSGNYSEIYAVVGKNIIAKDKDGYTRLFTEKGKPLSAKYGGMEFFEDSKEHIIAKTGGYGYILDPQTGSQKAGPFYGLERYNNFYLIYYSNPVNFERGLIYIKDLSVVNYENKPFLFSGSYNNGNAATENYGDAVLVNTDNYGGTVKKYFVLGGKVIADIGQYNPVSIYSYYYNYEKNELYYIPKNLTSGDLYAGAAKLTDGNYYIPSYYGMGWWYPEYFSGFYQDGKDKYYFISAEKTVVAQNKYCALVYKVGGATIKEVYSSPSSIDVSSYYGFQMAHNYALIGGAGGKLVNFITGDIICENVSEAYPVSISVANNNTVKVCQYFDRNENKYHIVGLDGKEISASFSNWYAYVDGKFVVSKGQGTKVTLGDKTYGYYYVNTVGRSIIQAYNSDWTYDLYNSDGGLIMEKTDSCNSYVNGYDNFEYYIIKYKNGQGESRARFYIKGKGLSDEFYDCKAFQVYNGGYSTDLHSVAGGEKARIASAVTSIKKVQEPGKEEPTEYPQHKVFDLNTFKLTGGEFDVLGTHAVPTNINNEAKILITGIKYNFGSDKKIESADVVLNFVNTGKSAEIKGNKDIALGQGVFTGVTFGATFADNKKGGVYTEVYGDTGKKVKTIKNFALGYAAQTYFASKNKPYTVFVDDGGKYGIYDKSFKVTVKPVYDDLEITKQGAVFAIKGSALLGQLLSGGGVGLFGILSLEGKEILAPKQIGIYASTIIPFALVITDSIQYIQIYDGAGKKLFDKVYAFGYIERYKLKEDEEPEPEKDYMAIGATPQKENVEYLKVYDGKYWRMLKIVI